MSEPSTMNDDIPNRVADCGLVWGAPEIVTTKQGVRKLTKALSTWKFFALWKSRKTDLKAAGYSMSPPRDYQPGDKADWIVLYWDQPGTASIEAPEKAKPQPTAPPFPNRDPPGDVDLFADIPF